jgi:ribosomal protein S18 acetylase RimI-like enzyme
MIKTQYQFWPTHATILYTIIKKNSIIASARLCIYDNYDVIESLYVDDPHKKKGYATKIIKQIIEHSTQQLFCLVDANNQPAFNLYNKLGFVHYRINEENQTWMKLNH